MAAAGGPGARAAIIMGAAVMTGAPANVKLGWKADTAAKGAPAACTPGCMPARDMGGPAMGTPAGTPAGKPACAGWTACAGCMPAGPACACTPTWLLTGATETMGTPVAAATEAAE